MMSNELQELIRAYLRSINDGLSLLKEVIGDTRPLIAWHNKTIARTGELSSGVRYEFHGVGCRFIFPDCEVDFDFGPDGRADGFDLWRLTQFLENCQQNNAGYSDLEKLKEDFEAAIKHGDIAKLDHPYSSLYFLRGRV